MIPKPPSPCDMAARYRTTNRLLAAVVGLSFIWAWVLPLWMAVVPESLRTCGTLRWLNRPCPLCGLTRAFSQILRGNLAEAQQLNAIALPLFVLLVLELVGRIGLAVKPLAQRFVPATLSVDVRLHLVMVITYAVYGILFMCRAA
ncbi:MAG: DUF2752 domain-containing protein [Verrucomicrobia bacterium]|nr:DUF2752 domain-containing protein [Verrucomicrobiota bacterium]